jgi:pyrroloquinoline quinone (PQQ) biosynthesis protein C
MQAQMPVLKRTAKVVKRSDDLLAIEYLGEQVTLEGAAAKLFDKMLPYLDGHTGIGGIAERIAESPRRLQSLTQQLGQTGVLAFNDAADAGERVTGEQFYELHRKYVNHWLQPIYDHPFWEKVVTGKASRAQVLGFAFEKYHYIEGAFEHMAIAAANATPEMMPHLARHFIEEYNHGDIYRKGLRSLFTDDVILRSQPLPSTRALVNFLSESAGRNSFGYYAGNELLQMTENTGEERDNNSVNDFYDAMRKHYPYTDKIIDAFIAHTNADQELGHEDVFLQMCQSIPPLTRAEVDDALNIVRSMAEHLYLFMDGIDTFYARFPTVPRLPSDLLSE